MIGFWPSCPSRNAGTQLPRFYPFCRNSVSDSDIVEMGRVSVDTVGTFNAALHRITVHRRLPALAHFREFH